MIVAFVRCNLTLMELRHLRYFVVLAETLHFGRAAEALGITPPTLTVQIQEIERSLQARLLERGRGGVSLTAAGAAFLEEARRTLDQFERAQVVGRRAGRGEIGRIEVGYVGSAAYAGLLQRELAAFRQARPDVEVRVREFPMAEICPAIVDGGLDVGFVRMPMVLPAALGAHEVAIDRYILALQDDHALAVGGGPVSPRALAGETIILPEQEAGGEEVARRGRFRLEKPLRPGSLFAVLTQASLGAGVAIVPSVVAQAVRLPGLAFRTLSGAPIPSAIAAVFRRREAAPATRGLIAQLKAVSPEADSARPAGASDQHADSGRDHQGANDA